MMKRAQTMTLPRWQRKTMHLLPTLSSLVTGAAFLNSHLGWLVLVSLTPTILYILFAKNFTPKQIVRDIWFAGLIFSMIVLAWMMQTQPSTWTALQGSFARISVGFGWLSCSLAYSLGFLVIGWWVARTKQHTARVLLGLPFIWALSDVVRSYSYAILSYGPGSSLSPNWNLGALGLGAVTTPLAFLGRFVGLYGLTAVVVVVNIIWVLLYKRRWVLASLTIWLIVATSFAGWRMYRPDGPSLKLAAVHLAPTDSLEDWRVRLPAKDTDLLVLPEYSLFFDNPKYASFAIQNIGEKTIMLTTRAGKGLPPTNDLTYFTPSDGIINVQSKTFLIPAGENLPYVLEKLFRASGRQFIAQSFNQSQQIKRGDTPEVPVRTSNLTIGGLACSGVLSLSEYQRLTNNGAQVLANPASLSLLAGSSLYHVQETYLTRFHATANARPFVQASRSGESYILNSDGRSVAKASGQSQLISASLQSVRGRTAYSLIGDRLVPLVGLVLVCYVFRRSTRQRRWLSRR